jgi:nucleoid-associated protein YgaU
MFAPKTIKSVGLLLAVLAVVVIIGLRSAPPSQGSAPQGTHIVERGESLWMIAERYYDGDPRHDVRRLREVNGLEGPEIQVGQVLVLPAA